ncbi:glycosyltransferase involved in cell wall biosynthesis [Tenacibaculum skagerrakense]|uniref:Glycosyltransferase involved in cell wall biosynthesis n=1 Tax=Tenacibaculum skagerrakense TaxID=186571 RepID=A0A4V2SM38_9FLAO|nr:glycosyltransferase family 1 protein [Tenacibaculum skagerrakense]TCP25756.1 glycosyltransferase involved in cell wall biosynthesis [Tenacibaculum skagerrakense]
MRIGFDGKRAFHNATGLGNYSRDLLKILATHFSDDEYYVYNTKPKKIDRLSSFNNIIEKLPVVAFWKKFSSIWRQGPILSQLKKDQIQLYHGLSGEIPRGIKKSGIPSVVTIHDLIFVRYPELYSFFDRKIHFNKFKYASEKADKVIAISEQTKNDIITFLGIEASKIEVIYQGCHAVFKEEVSIQDKSEVKKKFNLPENFILNVGTIEERKNLLSIVKSIKELKTHLVVIGRKTTYYQTVLKYIDDNRLSNRVHFLEGVDLKELATIYQMAYVFVYPSIFEGFGIPIIEALYSKTPVITSKGGVFPEAGGPDTCYVDPSNTEEFSKAIENLLNNKQKRTEMADRGFTFVQKFNDDVIANNIMQLYRSILNERN